MTLVGRAQLDHPALGAAGGSALHASIESIYTVIGNDLAARYNTAASIANSAVTTFTHNFGVQFADLKVLLYTGTHPNLVRVADPVASGWVIAATVGFEKTQIDVTAPSSGGPHTFAVITMQSRGAEKLADLDDINTTAPIDGQFLIYDTATSEWIPAYLKYKSETATIASNTLTPTTGANIQRITSGAADLQMVASPVAGKFYVLVNETGTDFLIKNDTGGTAANRIYTGTGVDLTLKNQAAISLLYNSGLSRWIVAGGSGGGGLATELQSSAFTASAGKHYLVDNSASAFTGTLPAGSAGTVIRFSDNSRVWASRNFTIAPASGETIDGLAANETLVCDVSGAFVQVMWNGTKWIVDTNGFAASISSGSLSGGQGLGKKNYIGNPNNATNWVEGGSSLTVTTETTAANLPNQITQTTAIAFTRVSGTTGLGGFRFEMDRSDYSKPFEINIDQKSAFTTEGYQIQVWAGSVSGTYGTQLTVSNASLSGLTGSHIARVDMPGASTPFIEFRIVATGSSGTAPFYANNIYFGPGLSQQSYAGDEWKSYTPTLTNFGTTSTNSGRWRRVGSSMEIETYAVFTGTGSASPVVITIPSPYTIATRAAANNAAVGRAGSCTWLDDSAGTLQDILVYLSHTSNGISLIDEDTGGAMQGTSFGTGDQLGITVSVPISEWAGNGILNVGAGAQVEYAYNNSATTSSDTTSFAYGPSGFAIQNFAPSGTTGVTKRVQFQYPIQNGDNIVMEIQDPTTGIWLDINTRFGSFGTNDANTTFQGQLLAQFSSTQVNVAFYSTTVGGGSWASVNTWKWRLKKSTPSAPVGFGLAGTDGSSGLVNPYTAGSGVVYASNYTPTLVGTTNVDTVTLSRAFYSRVGKIVTVSGSATLDATAANVVTAFTVTLPVTSTLSGTSVSGSVGYRQGNTMGAGFMENSGTDKLSIVVVPASSASGEVGWSGQYIIA
jgi:hypothetical protein